MTTLSQEAPETGRSDPKRVERNYRRTRRKLLAYRQEGVHAVAGLLVRSYVARRLVGIDRGRPSTISLVEVTQKEVAAYRAAVRALELEKAIAMGGEARAREIRLEQSLARLQAPQARDLLRRIYALGGSQVLVFGFADDSSRRVVLLPGGGEVPEDGLPPVPLSKLIARACRDVFTAITTVRTEAGETVNVYQAKDAEFHPELRKQIYAVVVSAGEPMYMAGVDVEESLARDPRTMTDLPRVPGTIYCDWPAAPAEQGSDK